MGFFKNLFGTSEPKTEADQKNDTEKMFNIFHDDGVRAKNMGELKFAEQCFTKALEIRDDAPTRSYPGGSASSFFNSTTRQLTATPTFAGCCPRQSRSSPPLG